MTVWGQWGGVGLRCAPTSPFPYGVFPPEPFFPMGFFHGSFPTEFPLRVPQTLWDLFQWGPPNPTTPNPSPDPTALQPPQSQCYIPIRSPIPYGISIWGPPTSNPPIPAGLFHRTPQPHNPKSPPVSMGHFHGVPPSPQDPSVATPNLLRTPQPNLYGTCHGTPQPHNFTDLPTSPQSL